MQEKKMMPKLNRAIDICDTANIFGVPVLSLYPLLLLQVVKLTTCFSQNGVRLAGADPGFWEGRV